MHEKYNVCCVQEPDTNERWLPLDSEVVMENGQILCTKNPTGHSLLIGYRFEMPCGGKFFASTLFEWFWVYLFFNTYTINVLTVCTIDALRKNLHF